MRFTDYAVLATALLGAAAYARPQNNNNNNDWDDLDDISNDDIPRECQQVCQPVITFTDRCDRDTPDDDDDTQFRNCVCAAPDAQNLLADCEACVRAFRGNRFDDDDDNDDDDDDDWTRRLRNRQTNDDDDDDDDDNNPNTPPNPNPNPNPPAPPSTNAAPTSLPTTLPGAPPPPAASPSGRPDNDVLDLISACAFTTRAYTPGPSGTPAPSTPVGGAPGTPGPSGTTTRPTAATTGGPVQQTETGGAVAVKGGMGPAVGVGGLVLAVLGML